MIKSLFQQKRKDSYGKTRTARLWCARIKLKDWPKTRTIPLHVLDKRVAEQKLTELVRNFELEAAGITPPQRLKDAARTPIKTHLEAFLIDLQKRGRAANTLSKYRNCIPALCAHCAWGLVRDVTAQSFTKWRAQSALMPKTLNDHLAAMCCLLNWMKRQEIILLNPLQNVDRVQNRSPREFRRALSARDAQALLDVSPINRATVYLTILYTGLRSQELKGLTWGDLDLDANPPCLRVSASISKNRRASIHSLRPELAERLKQFRPATACSADRVFKGIVPRVPTFKRDLEAAGIPFEDAQGRRLDIHALRKSFCTMLAVSGAPLRVSMELMRHTESRLTERIYTDVSHLPLQGALNGLPSLRVKEPDTQRHTQAPDASGQKLAQYVSEEKPPPISQAVALVTNRHKKAPSVTTGRLSKMEQAKRLELSTSTLARWCSTN